MNQRVGQMAVAPLVGSGVAQDLAEGVGDVLIILSKATDGPRRKGNEPNFVAFD